MNQPGKKCSCGILWTKLPPKTPWIDEGRLIGHFFNCTCNSTLFIAEKGTPLKAIAASTDFIIKTRQLSLGNK